MDCDTNKVPKLSYRIELTDRGKKAAALFVVSNEFASGEFDFETESIEERMNEILSETDKGRYERKPITDGCSASRIWPA